MTDKGTQFGMLHWGPCVVHTKLQKPILDKLYVAAIGSQKSANEELAGVLKEQLHIKDKDQFGEFFNSMFNLYNHALKQWRKDIKQDSKYFLEKLWCNFQKKDEFNPPHSHGGALSFVIYLKVPEELKQENEKYDGLSAGPGGITFLYGQAEDYTISNHSFFPEEGDMYIFPAYLKHWVYPYKSDCIRVSVSGNVIDGLKLNQMKKKNGKG